jgi:predicted ester cyclase
MTDARELLKRDTDPAEYQEIRALWKAHSIAEDQRNIAGLLATLTEDCVYEVVTTGHRWEGLDGARRFYTELLTAFPDVHFELENIVIGPQGVCEEANVTGTHQHDWGGFTASGGRVAFKVIIFFPWDRARKRFRGERVFVDFAESGRAGVRQRSTDAERQR